MSANMKRCLKCNKTFDKDCWTCSNCGWSLVKVSGSSAFEPVMTAEFDHYPEDASALYELEADSFWFRNRNKPILKALGKDFPQAASLREISYGTGFVAAGIAATNHKLRLVGSDLHHEALEYAQTGLPEVELLQMDTGDIPYIEEFDVVCIFNVLEHIPQDDEVLKQIHQPLKRGGG